MYALLKEQEDLFIKFGGHAGACGFLMQAANLDLLRDNLNLSLEKQYGDNEELFYNRIQLDASVTIADLTMAFVNQLDLLEPFGHKNERPLFELPKVSVSAIYFMGEDRQHARFTVSDGQGQLDCILFGGAKDFAMELEKGAVVSLAGYPDINIWREVSKIQFVVKDIKCYINIVD
jgi:single-stranded-DNA-specific exonuclease